jgi:hypothetical protein
MPPSSSAGQGGHAPDLRPPAFPCLRRVQGMMTPSPGPENPLPAPALDRPAPARPGAHPLAAAIRGTVDGAARAVATWLIEFIQEHIH